METSRTLRQLSFGEHGAVHSYYDLPIESPDGSRIVYNAFDSEAIPGPVSVIVADRDGANPRVIGHCTRGNGHVGAQAMWIDDDHVVYCPEGPSSKWSAIVKLGDEPDRYRRLDHKLRSFHRGRGLGAMTDGGGGHGGPGAIERFASMRQLWLWQWPTGQVQPLLHTDAVSAIHPRREQFDPACVNFQNPKFSPDGRRMLVVMGDEVYCKPRKLKRRVKSLIVFDVDAARPNPRYLGEFADHPMWTPDGTAIIAHDHAPDGNGKTLSRFDVETGRTSVLLRRPLGVHPSMNRAATQVVTDPMGWPRPDQAAVVMYDLESGEHEVLATGGHGATDHETGCHVHPKFAANEKTVIFNMADTGVPQVYEVAAD